MAVGNKYYEEYMSFTSVVEDIQELPRVDKLKVRYLLDKYLLEEKREKIYKKYQKSLKRAKEGKLTFSSNIDELINSVKDNHD
jgi:hypothetical protein